VYEGFGAGYVIVISHGTDVTNFIIVFLFYSLMKINTRFCFAFAGGG
jgi:hypothetical protein